MEGICYIVAAGDVERMNLETSSRDLVIAADGGYLNLPALSARADLVVGDFDSLPLRPDHPGVVEYPKEKDETDTMLAVKEGLRRGYGVFVILGGLGGRLDHTYANFQVLHYLALAGARGFLLGGGVAATVVHNGAIRFRAGRSGAISVFCCGGTARGVYIRGLRYELSGAALEPHFPLGVSNEFVREPAEVSVSDGSLLVMWEDSVAAVVDSLRKTCYTAL